MTDHRVRSLTAALATALLLATPACQRGEQSEPARASEDAHARPPAPSFSRDLPEILTRDTLVVLTTTNSTTYFLYRGEPLGYEYELMREFAADHELTILLLQVADRDSMFAMLADGRGDVAMARLIPMPADSGRVSFTHALYRTDPVLVQQEAPTSAALRNIPKPADTVLKRGPAERAPHPISPATIRARLVTRPAELANKDVHLPEQSPYQQTLFELADSISGDINVIEVDASSEAVIREVAKGNIEFTVAEGNLADLQEAYFRNLRVRPIVGASKGVAWAVRRNAPALLAEFNAWIAAEKQGPLFDRYYKKYFVDTRGYQERVASRYLTSETGHLSPYDSLFKRAAAALGWDWRLLASQSYQESRFKPTARSWAGAVGLLQLMPATGRQFGVHNPRNPADNVQGATKFIKWLVRHWEDEILDPNERLKFVLASYNTGVGHVEDAQRLAERNGDDPKVWKNVAYWLLQKSKREVYTLPEVKYGFCRGLEPVTYVAVILDRFAHYKQFVVDRPEEAQKAEYAQ